MWMPSRLYPEMFGRAHAWMPCYSSSTTSKYLSWEVTSTRNCSFSCFFWSSSQCIRWIDFQIECTRFTHREAGTGLLPRRQDPGRSPQWRFSLEFPLQIESHHQAISTFVQTPPNKDAFFLCPAASCGYHRSCQRQRTLHDRGFRPGRCYHDGVARRDSLAQSGQNGRDCQQSTSTYAQSSYCG